MKELEICTKGEFLLIFSYSSEFLVDIPPCSPGSPESFKWHSGLDNVLSVNTHGSLAFSN